MVNMENYEEYMLLEADGELNETEQKALFAFIEKHPALKEELAAYQSVRLAPDLTQVFEGKEQLLKTMPPRGRTIPFKGWLGYSAAAAACLAAVLFIINRPERATTTVVKTNIPVVKENILEQPKTTEKSFHSQPASPVAIENKKEPRAIVKTKEQKIPAVNVVPHEVKVPVNEMPIVKQEQEKIPEIVPETPVNNEYIAETENQDQPMIPKPAEEKNNRKLLALLPVEDKLQGISEIQEAVNEKIEKLRSVKEKLRDTDVTFKIGKKEIFVVKL